VCVLKPSWSQLLRKILDARQLGLKYIANVTYGYTSATFSGRMPAVEIADSIVQSGRETLEKVLRHPIFRSYYHADGIE
jgi:DNA polymerase zeta